MKTLFVFLASLMAFQCIAQNNPVRYYKPDMVPASPTAANLGKYGDIPVSMYTGMANVSIPIFNVEGRDISLPISLSYNYSGLKPNEQIGWMGLGWSLQAGGVITRTIKGKQDAIASASSYEFANMTGLNHVSGVGQDTLRGMVESGTYDGEPDIFSFNFGKYSGKFLAFKNRFYVFPSQKIKVTGSAAGFTITTEDGTMYEFYATETTYPKNTPGVLSTGNYVSAWYLTKITNASNTESINLNYTYDGQITQLGVYSQTYVKAADYTRPSTLSPINLTMPTFVNTKRLASITSSKYTVSFNPESSARADVKFGTQYALRSIGISSVNGQAIKSVVFDHSYFGGSDTSHRYLKLDRVKECADLTSSSDSLVHSFEYYNNGFPERHQPGGVDHYGFYSAGASTSYLLPASIYPDGGANRNPDFTSAVSGSLKKITYPTGGTSEFEYENNALETGGYVKQPMGFSKHLTRPSTDASNLIYANGSFNLNVGQMVKVGYSRFAKNPPDGDDNAKDNRDPEIKVYSVVSGVSTLVFTGKIYSTSENGGHTDSVSLNPGNYTYTAECDASEYSVDFGIDYYFQTGIPNTSAGPGVRVKKIISSPKTGLPIQKNYTYAGGAGLLPVYSQQGYDEWEYPSSGSSAYVIHSYTTYTSFLAEGSGLELPFFYTTVTEDTGTDTANISRSVHTFQNFGGSGTFLGVEPVKQEDYKKVGSNYVLLHKLEYNYNTVADTSFVTIKPYVDRQSVVNGASLGSSNHYSADAIMLQPVWKYLNRTTETIYNNDTLVTQTLNSYNQLTRNLQLTRQNGSDGTATIQKMKYPEDYSPGINANFISAHVLSPVFEKQVWQKRSSADSSLISGTVSKYDSVLFQPVKIYALASASGITAPNNESVNGSSKYTTLLSDTRYQQRVSYTYDADGKLVTQQLTNGIPVSYQWAYPAASSPYAGKSNWVVAECKNGTVIEFFTNNFEDNTSAATGAAHTGYRYYNGSSYTVSWARPNSRAYVISYWYKNGTWKYSGEVPYTGSTYTLSAGTAYDDIRIYPADAQVATYTYLPGVGVSSTLDAKGITNYYEYDGLNRLLDVKDQYGNILKYNTYNMGTARFANATLSATYTRNNCTAGQIGELYTYTVPIGKYISAVSQADADSQAAAEQSAYGQSQANGQALCKAPVTLSYVDSAVNAGLSTLVIKNTSGTVLYTFGNSALAANPSIPQGTYTFEYHTDGDCFELSTGEGWRRIYLTQGYQVLSACNATGIYTLNNVNLTAASSCTITMTSAALTY